MLRCPSCHSNFEAQSAQVENVCPHCGLITALAPEVRPAEITPAAAQHAAPEIWPAEEARSGGISLSGRPGVLRWTKNVAVRFSGRTCPQCGHTVARGALACPYCGRILKPQSAPARTELSVVLRKMLLAAILFIGLPAAVIVFILVVCAPEEGDVAGKGPKQQPSATATDRNGTGPTRPDGARPGRRGPRSALSSMRAWVYGLLHGGASVPAKPALENPDDGTRDAQSPPAGAGNGNQVKPDPAR
jgi:predicted RNA-binding Zn-ribbon protein involved in translation (DUF1610 family)